MDFLELQALKVDQVIEKLKQKDEVVFKSPTGSGKTIMLADIMNKMIEENPDCVFLVSSLSKGELAEQNYNSFNKRKERYCPNLKPYLIKSIENNTEGGNYFPINKNVYVLPRDLVRNNTRLTKDNSLNKLLYRLQNDKNKTVILIKDECHNTTSRLDEGYSQYFSKRLLVSATPDKKKGQIPDVELTEQEAISTHLIKEVEYHTEDVSLTDALRKYKEIKKKYLTSLDCNPCMLIQISNEDTGEEQKNIILKTLQETEFKDLHWIYIVGEEDKNETNDAIVKAKNKRIWRKDTKDNGSSIDIVIFKLSLAEGWDIPRACMLYQIRDTQSKTLDEQVIGRVRRNPKLFEFDNLSEDTQALISKAYIYGVCDFKKSEKIKIETVKPDEIKREIKIKTTIIKPEIKTMEIKNLIDKTIPLVKPSIFKLNKDIRDIKDKEIKGKINEYIQDYSDWFDIGYNTKNIKSKIRKLNNSGLNPEIKKDVNGNEIEISLPENSAFITTDYRKDIKDWAWKIIDDNEREFSFDSEAEKEWFEKLYKLITSKNDTTRKTIGKKFQVDDETYNFLIAKNYLDNSEICFEYYNNGVKKSYPDFVLKDRLDRLHFFESKSLNISASQMIDNKEYNEKIYALRKGYKETSAIVPYHFYIPIKEDDTWNIYHSYNGIEEEINCDKLKEILKGEN